MRSSKDLPQNEEFLDGLSFKKIGSYLLNNEPKQGKGQAKNSFEAKKRISKSSSLNMTQIRCFDMLEKNKQKLDMIENETDNILKNLEDLNKLLQEG